MKAPLLNLLSDAQAMGAEPQGNAWVSASAGTGKTQVLIARVLRLLLAGVRPESILCITFTKAGASEMARRIRDRLALWVRMSDADLRKDLLAVRQPGHGDAQQLRFARTLFAEVIDAPGGGLAIQTIHSFCQSLLASFPDEAGLIPGFRLLDDRARALLMRDVLTHSVNYAVQNSDFPYLNRLESLSARLGEGDAIAYLERCAGAHEALDALPAGLGAWLRGQFDLPLAEPQSWLAGRVSDDAIDLAGIAAIIEAYVNWNTKTGHGRADAIREWLGLPADLRAEQMELILRSLVTAKGEIYADFKKPALQHVEDIAQRLADKLGGDATTAQHMRTSDTLADALEAGRQFARAVAERKRREGLVDFDDLIAHTSRLLADPARSSWIRYKLDARIDHILVDEAQDTNAAQWEIVEGLAEEYFAGAGVKDPATRTLFVVGDYKQAIFGFQGTDPRYFDRARQRFAVKGEFAERPFAPIGIDTNFRSSRPILEMVDAVIADVGPTALGLSDPAIQHIAADERAHGRVVLWPAITTGGPAPDRAEGEDDGEDEGGDYVIDSATQQVADRIAMTVADWLAHGIDGEPVAASDVMILVRKRSDIAALVVSRLQRHGVPVAGIDRLRLGAPIGVQDLIGAARFAVQPLDDLNLAELLVSPLIGWTHAELAQWARRERGVALWPHLRALSAEEGRLEPLYALLRMAGFVTPYRFFETILSGPMAGREKLLTRLGEAARDPIEELASQALDFEQKEGGSLHEFLRWFDGDTSEIKRENENGADEVRVMTVHGSKGLQSRIVILADATVDPASKASRGHDWESDAGTVPLIACKAAERPDALAAGMADTMAAEMREHWRLLYVAMTRAERMLFVTGGLGVKLSAKGPPADSWYAAIERVLAAQQCEWQDSGDVWQSARIYSRGKVDKRTIRRSTGASAAIAQDLPAWTRTAAPQESRPPRPLAPSALGDGDALDVAMPPAHPDAGRAAERGRLMHALFERLPAVDPAARQDVALRWLAAAAADFTEAQHAAMAQQVCETLLHPEYQAVFGPGSLAEVPFSAVADGQVIAGTVDRLIVAPGAVHVVDFKTGQFVPATAEQVPVAYLRQMAAYRAALSVIFPGHAIHAALLYSAGPLLIDLPADLPADLLDQHKPRLATPNANLSGAA